RQCSAYTSHSRGSQSDAHEARGHSACAEEEVPFASARLQLKLLANPFPFRELVQCPHRPSDFADGESSRLRIAILNHGDERGNQFLPCGSHINALHSWFLSRTVAKRLSLSARGSL